MTDLRARLADVLPGVRRDLDTLIRIQSVSADPERAGEVQRSASTVRDLFAAEGFDAQVLSVAGGAPAVVARKAGPNLNTEAFIKVMDTLVIPPDMFGSAQMTFSPTKRLGSDASRLSQITDGKWKVVSEYFR